MINAFRGNVIIFSVENKTLPGMSVSLGELVARESSNNGRIICDGSLTFSAHSVFEDGEHPEDIAILMLADIQTAVEIESFRFGGLLTSPGIEWAGQVIVYPEEVGNVVSVSVVYSFSIIRYVGDPGKPTLN